MEGFLIGFNGHGEVGPHVAHVEAKDDSSAVAEFVTIWGPEIVPLWVTRLRPPRYAAPIQRVILTPPPPPPPPQPQYTVGGPIERY